MEPRCSQRPGSQQNPFRTRRTQGGRTPPGEQGHRPLHQLLLRTPLPSDSLWGQVRLLMSGKRGECMTLCLIHVPTRVDQPAGLLTVALADEDTDGSAADHRPCSRHAPGRPLLLLTGHWRCFSGKKETQSRH